MRAAEGTLRYRLQETRALVWRALVPNDRPTPFFTLLTVTGNGAQLIRGFDILLSLSCSAHTTPWCALGLSNTIVNMIYAIVLMWRMRYRIEQGIPLELSTFRLFFMEPINIAFLVYVVWEIFWMLGASWIATTPLVHDACGTYISVQLGCCSVLLILGTALLLFTFMTELLRKPRWRLHANEIWRRRYSTRGSAPLNLTNILRDDHRTDMGTIPESLRCHTHEEEQQGEEAMVFAGQAQTSRLRGMVAGSTDAGVSGEGSRRQGNTLFPTENEGGSPRRAISCFSPRACEQGA
ncbi:uncharacterized protein Tco025E_04710 [Trypanosoma conorhini]|uniref:Transmembrane protein n=1 Tax=Trypanosoma conorhini TaxID=83891 RepID=A0A3R7LNF3_9TRYP|nr:uncharacterized protein Tco025E_04710 [Trypanosoma conorhini]RNF17800.1 hypothetical protein Tco025E_04710 [Trypanosoma conorhini]